MRSLPFLLHEALVNLRRHGLMTIAAITTIAVALALIGTFLLTFYEVSVATKRTLDDFEMRVFCVQSVTKAQIPALEARIKKLPGVGKVGYVSKEHTYNILMKGSPDEESMPNVFNETIVVKMIDPKRGNDIKAEIEAWRDVVQQVNLPSDELKGVLNIAKVLQNIGAVGGIVLLFGALMVVANTVRVSLFSRQREIKIMQIVGASGGFIRLPLLIEGLIHGLIGGALAAAAVGATGRLVSTLIQQSIPTLTHYFEPVDMLYAGAAIVASGLLVGAIGSLISMHRYLRLV